MYPRVVNGIRILLLGALMVLVLASCDGGSPTPTLTTTDPTPTPMDQDQTGSTPDPGEAPADSDFDAEAYFSGQTIRLITSSNPGGGTDTIVRYFASAGGDFIPGNPRLVVSNVPPHVVGMNFIWNAEPDGLTLFHSSQSMLNLEHAPGAQWDASQFTYIGDVGSTTTVFVIRGDLPYEDVRDAMGASEPTIVTMAPPPEQPGAVSPSNLESMLIAEFLDLPLEVVQTAEDGTGPSMIALERGDINGYRYASGGWLLIPEARPGWFEEGFLRPFYHAGPDRAWVGNAAYPEPTFPHVYDLFTEEQLETYKGLVESGRAAQIRPWLMPPGVPSEVTAALEEAFEEMVHDEEFCEGLERVGFPCAWTPGEEVLERTKQGQALRDEWQDEYEDWSARMFKEYVR